MKNRKIIGDLKNLLLINKRLKRVFFGSLKRKQEMRKELLDIQDSVKELMCFRKENQDNNWSETLISYSLKLQNSLLQKYQKKYGEFPFAVVEVVQ